jgi:hypothetical protein
MNGKDELVDHPQLCNCVVANTIDQNTMSLQGINY